MYRNALAGGIFLTTAIGTVSPAAGQATIGRNFTASTLFLDSNQIPPDTMGAAGVDHFVELINGRYSVFRKSDGARVQTSTQDQFWTNAGAPPTNGSLDPRVVYDPYAQRWYACAIDNRQNANSILVAVSKGSDPTLGWTGFKVDSDTDDSHWADFPMIGYNREGVFVSANMPTLTAPGTRTAFLVLPKQGLLAPVPTIANRTLFEDVPLASSGGSPQMAFDMDDGLTMPILSPYNVPAGTFKRSSILAPAISPTLDTAGGFISSFAAPHPPTVDQPGPKQNLAANDARFYSNTVLNNGELWAVHSIEDMGVAALRYLRLDAATNAVIESAIIVDPAGRAFTFPSIAVNDFGDVVIGMTGTSTTEFASSYAIVGNTVGGTTSFGLPMLLKAGVSDYERLDSLGRNRWGDYSATTVDPADPSIFWTTQEFVSGTNVWSTQVTELIIPLPSEARWADPVPVGMFDDPTMWLNGMAPGSTSEVIFSRATDPGAPPMMVMLPPQPAGVYVHQRLSVRQGNLLLDLGGNTWDLFRSVDVGPYGGAPQVVLANGTLSSGDGNIAMRPNSQGFLRVENLRWDVHGELNVGGIPGAQGGRGILSVDANSEVNVDLALRVWSQGTVQFNSGTLNVGPLDVRGGGRVFFGATGPARALRCTFLDIAPGGLIDMTHNAMIIDYTGPSAIPPVVVNLISGYAGGTWTGPGINSSTAASGVTHGIGFAEAAALGLMMFAGQPVDPTTVVLRYTRYGDADLNGLVNLADFNILAGNFGMSGKYWWEADFNYDSVVNLGDFNLLAANFGLSAGPDGVVDSADWAALAAAVPEPGAAAFLPVASAAALRRRRRALGDQLSTPAAGCARTTRGSAWR